MWKAVLLGLALGLGTVQASAQNRINKSRQITVEENENKTAALNELSNEYFECAAYFTVTAYCIGGYPAPGIPKLVRDNQHLSKTALDLVISNGGAVRLTKASAEAELKSVAGALMRSINNNCLNIRNLSERYDAFCGQLMRGANERFPDLLAGRICTGHFKCELGRRSGE
jgi:hypothetical protein